jgi:hypothetical protein
MPKCAMSKIGALGSELIATIGPSASCYFCGTRVGRAPPEGACIEVRCVSPCPPSGGSGSRRLLRSRLPPQTCCGGSVLAPLGPLRGFALRAPPPAHAVVRDVACERVEIGLHRRPLRGPGPIRCDNQRKSSDKRAVMPWDSHRHDTIIQPIFTSCSTCTLTVIYLLKVFLPREEAVNGKTESIDPQARVQSRESGKLPSSRIGQPPAPRGRHAAAVQKEETTCHVPVRLLAFTILGMGRPKRYS